MSSNLEGSALSEHDLLGSEDFDPAWLTRFRDPNLLLVVSAPSGAGKSTICRRVINQHGDVEFSVSTTTRDPRNDEIDGEDYHFVNEATFDNMVENGEFLEWAHVHGERYGTSRETVINQLEKSRDVILDIDIQGARQVQDIYPDAVFVFVAPPSMEELERRLRNRDTETEDQIKERLNNARE
ncbi:MAG: guanylate kinase [bacterium]